MEITDYICEWCDPRASIIVQQDPEKCRIAYCKKHKTVTWHAPRKLIEEAKNEPLV